MTFQEIARARPIDARLFVPPARRARPVFSPSSAALAIMQSVATRYGLTAGDLIGPDRSRWVSLPRQEAMARIRTERPNLSLPHIGRIFGGRDHTVALDGIRRHHARMAWAEALIAIGQGLIEQRISAASTATEFYPRAQPRPRLTAPVEKARFPS